MRTGLVLLALLMAGSAQSRPWLCEALLDRCDLIVQGTLISDRTISANVQLTEFRVSKVLKGSAAETVRVGGMGPRGGALPDLPKLLFLRQGQRGSVCSALDVVDLTEADQWIAPHLVAETLRLSVPDPAGAPTETTAVARRALAITAISTESVFARRTALRELDRLAQDAPLTLEWEDSQRVRERCARLAGEDAEFVRAVSDHIRTAALGPCAGTETGITAAAERAAFGSQLARFLRAKAEDQPAALDALLARHGGLAVPAMEALLNHAQMKTRLLAVERLGNWGSEGSAKKLLAFTAATSAAERRARIDAAGRVATQDALDVLIPLLSNGDVIDATLTAIARCGGSRGREVLERVAASLVGKPAESARLDSIRLLLSPAFTEAEALRLKSLRGRARN